MAILKDYSGGITETAVIASHREITEHRERMKSAQGKLREARKRAEESGMDPKAYDLAMKLMKMDEVAAVDLLNKTIFYTKMLRAPIGAQLNFIDMVTDNANLTDEQRLERWYDEGYNAGANGQGQDACRHQMNMPAGQAWLNGWSSAQAELAKGFKPLDDEDPGDEPGEEQVEAAAEAPAAEEPPKRRGRPPGSGSKRKPKEPEAAAAPSEDGPIAPADGWGDAGGVESYNPNAAPPPPPPASDDEDEMVPFDDAPPPPPADDAPAFVH